MTVTSNVLGDLLDWVVGVFERIRDISVYWVALALALKTAESAFIGLGWRNILRAAYPESGLFFCRGSLQIVAVCGGYGVVYGAFRIRAFPKAAPFSSWGQSTRGLDVGVYPALPLPG